MSQFMLYTIVKYMNLSDKSCRLADLIELRKLRRSRQGIDVSKLNKGDVKKKRRRPKDEEEEEEGGLRKGASSSKVTDDEE